MAKSKDNRVPSDEGKENKIETKRLDDLKNTPENKKAIAALEGRSAPSDEGKAGGRVLEGAKENKTENVKTEENTTQEKKESKFETVSKSAVEKVSDNKSKKEDKVEFEREYVVPLKRRVLNVPRYRRAKKAVRVLKEFIVRHMKVRDRDLSRVKVDINLNNEIWFRGIKKPVNKIKVKAARKSDGTVEVTLAEIPKIVEYKIKRLDRRKATGIKTKPNAPAQKDDDKNKDGVNDKKQEKEDEKSEAIKDSKMNKEMAKAQKHTTKAPKDATKPIMKEPKKN